MSNQPPSGDPIGQPDPNQPVPQDGPAPQVPYPGATAEPGQPPAGQPPAPGQGGDPAAAGQGRYQAAPGQGGYPPAPGEGQGPGGYPPAPGGYQAAPQMGAGYGGPAAPVSKPKSIELAVKLMYAGAGLSLLSILSTFLFKGQIEDQVRDTLTENGQSLDDLDATVTAALMVSVILGLIGVALWVWMARSNAAGKSWARIVATVLGGISVLSMLGSLAQPAPGLSRLLSLVTVLLAVAILVLLWKKESSAYYQAKSRPQF